MRCWGNDYCVPQSKKRQRLQSILEQQCTGDLIIIALPWLPTTNTKQIIPPIDKGIAQSIEDNLEVWPDSWNTSIVYDNNDLCVDPYDDVYKNYYNDLLHCSQHR